MSDITREYKIPPPTLPQWRLEGLKVRRKGNTVLVKQTDLEDWLDKHPIVKKPLGRPKKGI